MHDRERGGSCDAGTRALALTALTAVLGGAAIVGSDGAVRDLTTGWAVAYGVLLAVALAAATGSVWSMLSCPSDTPKTVGSDAAPPDYARRWREGVAAALALAAFLGAFGVLWYAPTEDAAHEGSATVTTPMSRCPQYAGRTFYRYVSEAEAKDIEASSMLKVFERGPKFWTDERYRFTTDALERLALPDPKPTHRVAFTLLDCPQHDRSVRADFGRRGGGYEFWSNDNVPVEFESDCVLVPDDKQPVPVGGTPPHC